MTRPRSLTTALDKSLREHSLGVPCDATIGGLVAHWHPEEGSLGAPSGAHDDLVIALALANYCCLHPAPRPVLYVR